MGFSGVQGWRVQPAHLIFFVLVSAGIMLVIDLDRPRSGLVLVSPRPMVEALADMNAAAASTHQVLKP